MGEMLYSSLHQGPLLRNRRGEPDDVSDDDIRQQAGGNYQEL